MNTTMNGTKKTNQTPAATTGTTSPHERVRGLLMHDPPLLAWFERECTIASLGIEFVCSDQGENTDSGYRLDELRGYAMEDGGDIGASRCTLDPCPHPHHEHDDGADECGTARPEDDFESIYEMGLAAEGEGVCAICWEPGCDEPTHYDEQEEAELAAEDSENEDDTRSDQDPFIWSDAVEWGWVPEGICAVCGASNCDELSHEEEALKCVIGTKDSNTGDVEIVMLDAGLHREWLARRHLLIGAVIAEWKRAHGPVDHLFIRIEGGSGVQRRVGRRYVTIFVGAFKIEAVERPDDTPAIPKGLVPVSMQWDDGCGMDGGMALVRLDGTLDPRPAP